MENILSKIKDYKLKISQQVYIILFSLINVVFYSKPFCTYIWKIRPSIWIILFFLIAFIFLFNLLFSLILHKRTLKPISVLILLCNSACLYFMNSYQIQIDVYMLMNIFETNAKEVSDLISKGLLLYMFIFGILPSLLILTKIQIKQNENNYKKNLRLTLISFLLLFFEFSLFFSLPKSRNFIMKNRRHIINYVTPANYIGNMARFLSIKIKGIFFSKNVIDISSDAEIKIESKNNKKNLVILVIGESARSQNFSLNGYKRNTNEFLESYDIMSFKNFYSCGTCTIHSIPCIFSHLDRKHFTILEGKKYENLLDILKKVDFDVKWRSNNGDCKGVCNRVNYLSTNGLDINGYDESLVKNLIRESKNFTKHNNIIVINQRGSHDPYYKRYPNEFRKFKPDCQRELNSCSIEEIMNAYDNSIYYSSYNLSRILDFLKKDLYSDYNVLFLYVSDHGDALGEDGLWAHSMPYNKANYYVKKIPMLLWFSDSFGEEFRINKECLKDMTDKELSHDNIFHSILGVFRIKSKYYDENLDIFNRCITDK